MSILADTYRGLAESINEFGGQTRRLLVSLDVYEKLIVELCVPPVKGMLLLYVHDMEVIPHLELPKGFWMIWPPELPRDGKRKT